MKHEIVVASREYGRGDIGFVRLCLTCGEYSDPPRFPGLYAGGADEAVSLAHAPIPEDDRRTPCESRK
jgi:hypothetical protein